MRARDRARRAACRPAPIARTGRSNSRRLRRSASCEAERQPVDRAEREADRCQPRHPSAPAASRARARGERYSVSSSATISTTLAVDSRSTSCRIVSRVSTENTPACHRERGRGGVRHGLPGGSECIAHGVDRAGLRVGVGPGGGRLHDEHRARAVARCPRRRGSPVPPRCRTGRRAWRLRRSGRAAASPGHEAGRRTQQVEAVAERLMQAGGAEALRRDGGASR